MSGLIHWTILCRNLPGRSSHIENRVYDRFAKQVGIISRSYSHLVTAVIYHLNHCHQAIQFGIIIIVIITVINIFMSTFIKMIITRVSSCSGSSTSTTLRLERRCNPSSNSPGHSLSAPPTSSQGANRNWFEESELSLSTNSCPSLPHCHHHHDHHQ